MTKSKLARLIELTSVCVSREGFEELEALQAEFAAWEPDEQVGVIVGPEPLCHECGRPLISGSPWTHYECTNQQIRREKEAGERLIQHFDLKIENEPDEH